MEETVFEHLDGKNAWTVSTDERKWKNKLAKLAEQHPAEVATFLAEYEASVNYLLENVSEAAEIIAAQGIFAKAPVAKKAIPNCNITYLDGAEMKSAMSEFLNVMIKAAPASIGGALPGDDFYYAVG